MSDNTDLDHAYAVVGEILDYFEPGAVLVTWAPVAALIMRERAVAREDAFREGYRRGFYSNGNFFPDESWQKYTNQSPLPPRREPTLQERPY